MSNQTQNELHEEEEEESPLALASQQNDEWVELTNHPDYEINVKYPHQIRNIKTKRINKESLQNNGYIHISLNNKPYLKHRLIAEQFIENDDPENKTEIDHINMIRDDNHIENLRWCSRSDNLKNKSIYNGFEAEYVDSVPNDTIEVNEFNGHEFEFYYYSQSEDCFYYYNGLKYRRLHVCINKINNAAFVHMLDKNSFNTCVYINKFKREFDIYF